jgi:hypothetical protein
MSWDKVWQRFDIYAQDTLGLFLTKSSSMAFAALQFSISSLPHWRQLQYAAGNATSIRRLLVSRADARRGAGWFGTGPKEDWKYRRMAYFRLGSQEELKNQAVEANLGLSVQAAS